MRSLSRGLLPPLLLDYGLAAALRAMMRRVDLDFTFDMAPTLTEARFPPPIESTVYLCCQAVLDAASGAGAAAATLRIWRDNGCLAFSVTHDAGMDWSDDETALRDRIATLGGNLVTDTAGQQSTVMATLPLTEEPGGPTSLLAGAPTFE
jgi:signal transduction histidine kinase